jgi:predicted ATPase
MGSFVGRRAQLETLGARVEAARGGTGQVVLVAGEPGIGKTRMSQGISAAIAAV